MASVNPLGPIEWRAFLLERPPGTRTVVVDAVQEASDRRVKFVETPLRLFCETSCRRVMDCVPYTPTQGLFFGPAKQPLDFLLGYSCRKCQTCLKTFAVRFHIFYESLPPHPAVEVEKIGEWPAFEPLTHPKLVSLIGPDRDLFLKGRRAEIAGLGVGAVAYYRRVVDNQKSRLLTEILRVATKTNAPKDVQDALQAAIREEQFSRAVDMVKDVFPKNLLINGFNPFTLLYSALSKNLHVASDEECLRTATDVRLVLLGLAERLEQALRDERELNEAASRLAT
jgi:hypothetical protein